MQKMKNMKRVIILLGLIFSVSVGIAQEFYTVQVRSLSRDIPLAMEELQAGMWQYKVDGQTKCFLGKFDTYEEAKAALEPLKVGKYAGAFVLSSDQIFAPGEVAEIPSIPKVTEAKVDSLVKNAEKKTTPAKKTGIKLYSIQIAAYRYPLYTKDFKLEEEVMEFYCSDNIYRYAVGRFADAEEARKLKKKIRESGYPDAFLIDYEKYESYRIE